jgi:hypothetical protein
MAEKWPGTALFGRHKPVRLEPLDLSPGRSPRKGGGRGKAAFGGRRTIIVKRGAACPRGYTKKIVRTPYNPRVDMCVPR